MSDQKKNKAQLMQELQELRHQMAELQKLAGERGWAGAMLAGDRQSEQLLRSIIDATPDWIFVKDQEHRYRLANQGYANALHVKPQDFIGKNDLDLGFPEELVKGNPEKGIRGFWADDRLVMDSGQPQVYPNDPATIDGVVHTFHTIKTPLRDAEGSVWGVLAFARDITERERVEEALRESEEKYRKILENIEEGYYEVDLAGSLTFFNDSLCRLYGYSRDELMGMNYRQYMDNETAQVVYQTYNTVYRTGESATAVDWALTRKDGTRLFIEVSVALMHGPTGEPVGFRGTIRDITERKRTESRLNKRVKELDCLNDIGRKVDETPAVPEFLQWVTGRIPPAMQYPDKCIVAVEFEGQVYGVTEALKLPCQMVGSLHIGGEQVGRLCVAYTEDHDFLDEESALLGSIVRRVSGYIENRRLLEEAKSRLAQLTALQETTKAVASTLELGKLLHLITQQATSLLQSQGGIINLVDWEKREDEVVASIGSAANTLGERSSLESNLSGWVSLHNQPVISNQLQHDSRANVGAGSWQSTAIAPLTVKDRVVGTLVVLDKQGGKGEFDQADLDFLTAFANQAAIAIQNVRLFEETQAALVETKTLAEALRASQERFTLATKGANDGLWDWDIQGKSLYWSPRFKELLGYADDELQIDFEMFNSLMHPDDRAPTGAAIDAHLKDRVLYDVEQRLLAKSGEYRWFRARGQAVWDEAGNPIRMVGFSTDITERKQAEAERERLLAEQARRALQLQTAAEVSRAASSILSLDELLPHAAELVRDRFNLYYVGLFLTDETGRWAVLRAATGEAGKKMLGAGHRLQVGSSSMIGWCVANAKARIALNVGEEAVHFENPLLPHTRSEMALPLISRGRVVGAATIQSDEPAAFTREDVTVLQTMADQVANAIENARLFDETQQRNVELTTLNEIIGAASQTLELKAILDAVLKQTMQVVGFDGGLITMYNETRDKLERIVRIGLPGRIPDDPAEGLEDSLCAVVFKTKELVVIEDFRQGAPVDVSGEIEAGFYSYIGVPLESRGQTLGTLCGFRKRVGPFGEGATALLRTVGRQIGFAIENARLFEQARSRAEEMVALNDFSRALATRLSVDQVLEEVYRGVSRLVDASNFYVSLYAPDKNEVTFPLQYVDGRRIEPEDAAPANLGFTGYLIRTRTPLLLRDKRPGVEEARLGVENVQFAGKLESKCWLGVPMIVEDLVLGTMVVLSYTDPNAYDEHDRDLLVAIASQTAIALQNAQLFEQAQTRAEEMAALNELSRALATALSVPQVLEEVYRGASRLLDTTNFYIALHDPERHEVSFAINATESVLDREITVLPADQGITGYIIRTRESVLIKSDVNGWLAERGMPHVGEPAQSWLGVPLMLGDQVLGVMAVQDYKTPNVYDESDRNLLTAIASQAAITLQNARSFEQAQARARREQTLREVTARLRGSTDPDTVMRTLARELGTVLGRPTFVRLVTPEGGKAEELTRAPATQMTDGQVAAS